ncbi:LuxR C-terminal-related transcriptional regulator [Pseudomonas sp. NPDC089734]|uniref:LuxR C-terminal-related transcriptional regulator n=1 Tax=Pseudomonas sp. NPDC089734 TaxID=3364469 RepID=UPI0038134441
MSTLKQTELKSRLTNRETLVVSLLAEGMSNKQIAQKISISEYTVRDHLSSVFKKMEVDGRLALLVKLGIA